MFSVTVTGKEGDANKEKFDQPEITIGRVRGNDIVLPKSNISKRHARILDQGGAFVVVDSKSTNGTYINGKRINEPYELASGDKVHIGDFVIEIEAAKVNLSAPSQKSDPKKAAPPPPPRSSTDDADAIFPDDDWDDAWDDDPKVPDEDLARPVTHRDKGKPKKKSDKKAEKKPEKKIGTHKKIAAATTALTKTHIKPKKSSTKVTKVFDKVSTGDHASAHHDATSVAVCTVHKRLLGALDIQSVASAHRNDEALRIRAHKEVAKIIDTLRGEGLLPKGVDQENLLRLVLDETFGLGPLQSLLDDHRVTEIMVNGPRNIYIERDGVVQRCDHVFSSVSALLGIIEHLVVSIDRHIDARSPLVDAQLADGSHMCAIIPPLSLGGPSLTIKKFPTVPLGLSDLIDKKALSTGMLEFLEQCVAHKKNILISGGTKSGKTTMLHVLLGYIPDQERIITIEDSSELQPEQGNIIRLGAHGGDGGGLGSLSARDLIRQAQRIRPSRIVLGQCRGGEALDMLGAMGMGHEGSFTTVHAETPSDALARMETMVALSGMEIPVRAVHEQLSKSVDVLIHLERFSDGTCRVTHIAEIDGIEDDTIAMRDIFVFKQQKTDAKGRVRGQFVPTGVIPKFYEALQKQGSDTHLEIFQLG